MIDEILGSITIYRVFFAKKILNINLYNMGNVNCQCISQDVFDEYIDMKVEENLDFTIPIRKSIILTQNDDVIHGKTLQRIHRDKPVAEYYATQLCRLLNMFAPQIWIDPMSHNYSYTRFINLNLATFNVEKYNPIIFRKSEGFHAVDFLQLIIHDRDMFIQFEIVEKNCRLNVFKYDMEKVFGEDTNVDTIKTFIKTRDVKEHPLENDLYLVRKLKKSVAAGVLDRIFINDKIPPEYSDVHLHDVWLKNINLIVETYEQTYDMKAFEEREKKRQDTAIKVCGVLAEQEIMRACIHPFRYCYELHYDLRTTYAQFDNDVTKIADAERDRLKLIRLNGCLNKLHIDFVLRNSKYEMYLKEINHAVLIAKLQTLNAITKETKYNDVIVEFTSCLRIIETQINQLLTLCHKHNQLIQEKNNYNPVYMFMNRSPPKPLDATFFIKRYVECNSNIDMREIFELHVYGKAYIHMDRESLIDVLIGKQFEHENPVLYWKYFDLQTTETQKKFKKSMDNSHDELTYIIRSNNAAAIHQRIMRILSHYDKKGRVLRRPDYYAKLLSTTEVAIATNNIAHDIGENILGDVFTISLDDSIVIAKPASYLDLA